MRLACCLLVVSASVAEAQVQDLGHKLPGGVGLDAGTQPEPGVYVGDRFVWFSSSRAVDRDGNTVPIDNLEIDAFANALGISGTIEIDGLYLTAAVAAPVLWTSLSADQPEVSIDRLGLGDVFLEPIQIGRRTQRFDVIASYALYLPTRQEEREGIGRTEWSHQVSAGGTLFLDDQRGWRVSALASYLHFRPKPGIDITRGDSMMVQGGIGARVLRIVDVGIAGYGLWQVTDDSGGDLPDVLRGARERVFGLGPEIGVAIPQLRSRFTARIEWDIAGRARPVGTLLFVGVTFVAWRPERER